MRVLIIGGTRFVGRHIAEAALAAGHELVLLNRGITGPDVLPQVEHLRADRERDLPAALDGRTFDAVVDTCAYFPRHVDALAPAADRIGHYTLISTISVYHEPITPGSDESARVWTFAIAPPQEIASAADYGGLKVLCERAAQAYFPERALIVRAGLLAGPHDHTARFTYWARRFARGGEILAADPNQPVQLLDARDLAAWIIRSLEWGTHGVFNAAGPASPTIFADLTAACRRATGSTATVDWVGSPFLLANHVEPWTELPLWLPPEQAALCQIDNRRALAQGLRCRSLAETAADVLAQGEGDRSKQGFLTPARERELLHARRGSAPSDA
jgi:2'-hydroxyisoflavone reductase